MDLPARAAWRGHSLSHIFSSGRHFRGYGLARRHGPVAQIAQLHRCTAVRPRDPVRIAGGPIRPPGRGWDFQLTTAVTRLQNAGPRPKMADATACRSPPDYLHV